MNFRFPLTACAAAIVTCAIAYPTTAQEKKEPPMVGQQPPTIGERLSTAVQSVTGNPMAQADTDMKRVLDSLAELNPKAIET